MSSSVKLLWVTPEAEQMITDCARVSNPANKGKDGTKLIKFLINNKHWSPFEMANACFEIQTTRAISAQLLRHRSFNFQEYSQRYAEVPETETTMPRRQDTKNRQNSIDDLSGDTRVWWDMSQHNLYAYVTKLYKQALEKGIAKECARMILPMCSPTTLIMNGTIRSWIHLFDVRCDESTQLENRLICNEIRDILSKYIPTVAEALQWDIHNLGQIPYQ